MAVEYIDSPNAGFIKLGEGVDLSTITPQQKRKIKRGDRGIFPITPTGAESYEGPDFKAQEAFSTPASAIPNVFDRYRTLPGGARAGGFPGGSFENVISPGTGNQNDDANDDDDDLEEELRRQTLDIDPVGDYDLSRFDPSSLNFDAQAVSDRDRQIDENQAMARAGIGFQDSLKVGIQDALHRASGGKKGQSFATSLMNATIQNGDPFGLTLIDGDSGFVEGKGKNNNTIGTTTAAAMFGIDVSALDTGGKTAGGPGGSFNPFEQFGARGGGTVATASTEIPKVGFDRTGGINQSIFNTTPSGVDTIIADPFDRNVPEFTGASSTQAATAAPAASRQGFEGDFDFAPDTPASDLPSGLGSSGGGGMGDPSQTGPSDLFDFFDTFSGAKFDLKDGGKISFMNIKK